MNQRALLAFSICLSLSAPATSMAAGCSFNSAAQKFSGTPIEQARCLLRRILPGGIVTAKPSPLTPFLLESIGKPVALSKQELSAYLKKQKISDREIGGPLGKGVSNNHGGNRAQYFVIHDTSDSLNGHEFPTAINDAGYGLNRIDRRDISMAHIMINRAGQSNTGREYSGALTATKLERIKDNTDGLFLHHELVQPRIKGSWAFHAVGPKGGFPEPQLKRLALLYVVASVRRGSWMIPAYHATIDEGIRDGHDDPQNFDLDLWSRLITQVIAEVKPQPMPQPAEQKQEVPAQPEVPAEQEKPVDFGLPLPELKIRQQPEEPKKVVPPLPQKKPAMPAKPVQKVEPKKVVPVKVEPKKVVPVQKVAPKKVVPVKKVAPKKVVPAQKVAPKKVVPQPKRRPKPRPWWEKPFWEWELPRYEQPRPMAFPDSNS